MGGVVVVVVVVVAVLRLHGVLLLEAVTSATALGCFWARARRGTGPNGTGGADIFVGHKGWWW